MNELIIKQLINEATVGLEPDNSKQTIITLNELFKFAELLIKECAEHCKGQMLDKEVADTNELTYNDAVMDCSNGLLQHFGVEE